MCGRPRHATPRRCARWAAAPSALVPRAACTPPPPPRTRVRLSRLTGSSPVLSLSKEPPRARPHPSVRNQRTQRLGAPRNRGGEGEGGHADQRFSPRPLEPLLFSCRRRGGRTQRDGRAAAKRAGRRRSPEFAENSHPGFTTLCTALHQAAPRAKSATASAKWSKCTTNTRPIAVSRPRRQWGGRTARRKHIVGIWSRQCW